MRRNSLVFALLAVIGAMGPNSRAEGIGLSSEENPVQLEDSIIISANRFGVAQSAMIWPARVIDLEHDLTQNSFAEALDGAGGIDARSYNGYGSLVTYSNWGSFARHMLLLYNGRVVRDYSLGGFNLSEFSPEEFSRVEIVKGPQSAFYGSDAIGGIINLVTTPAVVDWLNLHVGGGSNGFKEYAMNLSARKGAFGTSAFAQFSSSDNARANAGTTRMILSSRSDYSSADSRHLLSLHLRFFSDSLGVPGPQPDPYFVPAQGSFESTSLYDYQENENYSADLQYRTNLLGGESRIDFFWENKTVDYHSVWPDFFTGEDIFSRNINDKLSSGLSVRHQLTRPGHHFSGGLDWLYGRVNTSNFEQTFDFWSASQDQVDLWAAAGWRSDYSARFDVSGRAQLVRGRATQPSFNAGVSLQGEGPVQLKLAYGYAFRLPSISDQFAQSAFVVGNPELEAEVSETFSPTLSFRSPVFPVSCDFSLFYQSTNSLIQYHFDGGTFKFRPRNVERFRSRGVDLSVDVDLSRRLDLSIQAVIQSAKQTSDDGSRFVAAYYVPNIKARSEVSFEYPRVASKLALTYTSDRYLTMSDGVDKTLGRVYELSSSVAYRINGSFTLTLTGTDLTDQARPDQFGFTSSDLDYPTPGRQLQMAVDMRAF